MKVQVLMVLSLSPPGIEVGMLQTYSWNARGLNDDQYLAFVYVSWVINYHHSFLLFLIDTRTSFDRASTLFRSSTPNFVLGFDDGGNSWDLLVPNWSHNNKLFCIFSSKNVILCKIVRPNGKT